MPLIIALPDFQNAGQRTAALAEMVDFYPTLAELCDLPAPAYAAGISQAPALKNPAARPRKSALTQYKSGYSLRTARYRYTQWGPDDRAGAEFYDHQSHPEELVNLAGQLQQAETIQRLAGQLQERIAAAIRVSQSKIFFRKWCGSRRGR